jgi:hypothetical protein
MCLCIFSYSKMDTSVKAASLQQELVLDMRQPPRHKYTCMVVLIYSFVHTYEITTTVRSDVQVYV